MSIFEWVVLGLATGFIASKLITKNDGKLLTDVVLGMVGAVVAGLVYTKADTLGITMVNVYTILVALIGSMIMLFTYHKILKH